MEGDGHVPLLGNADALHLTNEPRVLQHKNLLVVVRDFSERYLPFFMQFHEGISSRKLNAGRIGGCAVLLLHPSIHKLTPER